MKTLLVSLVALVAFVCLAQAEKPNLDAGSLHKLSTHVVTGEVVTIYQRPERSGGWSWSKYLAEVRVATCEKGEGLSGGDLVYVRYWQRHKWIGPGPMPAGTNGHRGLPAEGETLRIYLARNAYDGFHTAEQNHDGGFNVIGANGFERLPEPKDQ